MDVFQLHNKTIPARSRESIVLEQAISCLKQIKEKRDYGRVPEVLESLHSISPSVSRVQSYENLLDLVKFDKEVTGC